MLKKTSAWLHLWIGLVTGILIFVIGISGSLFVFAEDLRPILHKDYYFVESPSNKQKLNFSVLKIKAQEALGEKKFIRGVEISFDPNRTYVFNARKQNRKGWFYNSFY
ncbi:MAG: PepSY domain-containing protein [Bacteroidota bacterium]